MIASAKRAHPPRARVLDGPGARYRALGSVAVGISLILLGLHVFGMTPGIGGAAFEQPSVRHPLGTDGRGADLLALIAAAQTTFVLPALIACAVGIVAGVAAGLAAAWYEGRIGALIRFAAVLIGTFPRIVLLVLIAIAFEPSFNGAAVAVGVTFFPNIMGEVRQRVADLKRMEFVTALRAHGIGLWRVIFVHLLRGHLMGHVTRQAFFLMAYVVLIEASFGYLGALRYNWDAFAGDGEPRAEGLGRILAQALSRASIADLGSWWPVAMAGAFLVILLGGLAALGEGVVQGAEEA